MNVSETRVPRLLAASALLALACSDDAPPRFQPSEGVERDASAPVAALPGNASPEGDPSGPPTSEPSSPAPATSPTAPAATQPSPSGTRLMPPGDVPPGATAVGGTPGSGGAGSAGQSSASGSGGMGLGTDADAGGEEMAEPADPGDFAVVCQAGIETTPTAQFSLRLSLLQYTAERIPIEQITVRYWFTSDNQDEPSLSGHQVNIDDAGPAWGERGNVTTRVLPVEPAEPGADTVVELGFGPGNCGGDGCTWPTSPRGTLAPEQRPIQLRVQIDPAALRYDLSDDHSYDPDASGQTACETINLYRDGVLIFGVEPDGTTTEPTPDAGAPVTDAGMAGAAAGGQGGDGGGAGQGGDGGHDAGGTGEPDAGSDPDASVPPEPEPAPLPDAGVGDASVTP